MVVENEGRACPLAFLALSSPRARGSSACAPPAASPPPLDSNLGGRQVVVNHPQGLPLSPVSRLSPSLAMEVSLPSTLQTRSPCRPASRSLSSPGVPSSSPSVHC